MSEAPQADDARVRAYVEAARQLAGAAGALRAVTEAGAKWPDAGQLEQLLVTYGGSLRRARRAWGAVPPPLREDLKAPDDLADLAEAGEG